MAVRVNDAEVKAIKPTTFDTTPFIAAANSIVDRVNSKCNKSFDEATLKQIELYLSAHFVCVADPALLAESFENATKRFQRGWIVGQSGLLSTSYGIAANAVSEGCLPSFDKQSPSLKFA